MLKMAWLGSIFLFIVVQPASYSQSVGLDGKLLASSPPMGWMTWNYFADKIHEKDIREMADAMVASGMRDAGYQYIFIDDGWQGGRDAHNKLIPDPNKFPSGMNALADYVHQKGLKLGIYSDAAPLTCAGYSASLHFEEEDAKTFASWGIDYLKYDYCGAPDDAITAQVRYKKMADALRMSGRDIVFAICEWGHRKPWLWASTVGGQLWRTTGDIRDKWSNTVVGSNPQQSGFGIVDVLDANAPLHPYSGPGYWNDCDMLVVGLYGKKGPSGDLGGVGCTDTEYQSQMSLWCMMNAPLAATNDLRKMNPATKKILLNKALIALNQDPLGRQAERKVNNDNWTVLVKPLADGTVAIAVLNRSDHTQSCTVDFSSLGLIGKFQIEDLWSKQNAPPGYNWNGNILSHETKVLKLKK